MSEKQNNRPDIVDQLPVPVSPEQAQKVGQYFTEILEHFGHPAEIPVGTKNGRTHNFPGVKAEITSKSSKLIVQKIEYESSPETFPEIKAAIFEKTKSRETGKKVWAEKERFVFNHNTSELGYRSGGILLYAISNEPQTNERAGTLHLGKRGKITVNFTPPQPEGVSKILENFLVESERIIKQRDSRIKHSAKRIGAGIKNFIEI